MEEIDEDYRKYAMAVLSVVRPMKQNLSSNFTCLLNASPEVGFAYILNGLLFVSQIWNAGSIRLQFPAHLLLTVVYHARSGTYLYAITQ